MATKDVTPNKTAWLEALAPAEASRAMVQLKSKGSVLLQMATARPPESNTEGWMLQSPGLAAIELAGIPADQGVYLRSKTDEDEPVAVVFWPSA